MSLLVVGVSHRTAPVELREQLAVAVERLPALLADLRREFAVGEVAVLSTCNRTEVYCTAEPARADEIVKWLGTRQHVDTGRLLSARYVHADGGAVRHMMRVASGLDSLVLGEPQVLGQMKDAYAVAHQEGFVGKELERCFQQVFAVAKRVRTETAIGANPVSVAFAAVSLARHLFADISRTHALLIGAGEMIELVARHLGENGIRSITVANRTLERAHALADLHGGRAVTMEEIPRALEHADVVISCTAAQVPVLGKGTVERALKKRRHRPLFMVDLAVPRDIEPEVAELADVYLYSIDDLQGVIDENVRARETAAREAEAIVDERSAHFLTLQREQGASESLRLVRAQVERLRDQELQKALAEIARGADPAEVLPRMGRALVNKILHEPSVVMRQAAADRRDDQLAQPETAADGEAFRRCSVEYAELAPVVAAYRDWRQAVADLEAARQMAGESDAALRELAADEARAIGERLPALEETLQRLLLPKDPLDNASVFLEIRAAAGGDEAAIFAGDLFRMYSRYADRQGWQVEVVNSNPGEHGGFREVIARVSGASVYSRLKFESGTHRVQRVPATEAQGRIHTSTCTVAVLPEVPELEQVALRKEDLKVDTFRASGAGGQHVNVTESAIRITHLPTGIVVECQDERSQHKNRARAMSLLAAKLLESKREAQQKETAAQRRLQVGTGDRSERIRTYNFPQGRVTDHRIELTLYRLVEVIAGDLDALIDPLVQEFQAEQLSALAGEGT